MNKRQMVLDTALLLIEDTGIQGMTTAALSKKSGVATGTLFHHFSNKEDIILQLFEECQLYITTLVAIGLDETKGT